MMLNELNIHIFFIAEGKVGLDVILDPFELYTIPLANWINTGISFIVDNFRPIFQAICVPIKFMLDSIETMFQAIPPLIFLVIIGLMIWQVAGRGIAIYSIAALTLIGFVGVWKEAIVTLSSVVTAVAFCVVIAIPLGVACARSDRLAGFVQPILDIMQTLPIFIFLVPVVMLFGIGKVSGVIATIVYALPPLIRLTNLGIRQVSTEVLEAAIAFGSTPSQVLWEAQIPLAMPVILAGLNQTILFALAMSVVTSMIGLPGLGLMVLQGVGRLDVGLAAVGGLGIVLLAIMLDRITQSLGKVNSKGSWLQRRPISFFLSLLRVKRRGHTQQRG